MEVLRWRTHLHPVLAAAMILILVAWLIILFKRQRANHTLKQAVLLLMPKVLIVLLLIMAYFDPVQAKHQACCTSYRWIFCRIFSSASLYISLIKSS